MNTLEHDQQRRDLIMGLVSDGSRFDLPTAAELANQVRHYGWDRHTALWLQALTAHHLRPSPTSKRLLHLAVEYRLHRGPRAANRVLRQVIAETSAPHQAD